MLGQAIRSLFDPGRLVLNDANVVRLLLTEPARLRPVPQGRRMFLCQIQTWEAARALDGCRTIGRSFGT